MKAVLNHTLFNIREVGTDRLNMLGVIVHRMGKEEELLGGRILQRGKEVGRFALQVTARCEQPTCKVDIGARRQPLRHELQVAPGGHVVFQVSGSGQGYGVQLVRPPRDGRGDGEADVGSPVPVAGETVFDSRKLGPGDLFAVTLVVPGRYTVEEELSGKRVGFRVTRANPDKPLRPARLQPVEIHVGSREITPADFEIGCTQGQVYAVQDRARLRIRLEEVDRGTVRKDRTIRRWTRAK